MNLTNIKCKIVKSREKYLDSMHVMKSVWNSVHESVWNSVDSIRFKYQLSQRMQDEIG
jgi:hypothetical protein